MIVEQTFSSLDTDCIRDNINSQLLNKFNNKQQFHSYELRVQTP